MADVLKMYPFSLQEHITCIETVLHAFGFSKPCLHNVGWETKVKGFSRKIP
jgi:hypothetical protein